MATQKQKQPEKQEIEIPLAYSDGLLCYMENTAKQWEEDGNQRMAKEVRAQIKARQKKQREFMLENGLIEPIKPKIRKKQKRELHGDTKPELIKKAIEALTPIYEERNGPSPTSVELFDTYAKVWFEFDEDDAEEDDVVTEWEYFRCVPMYYFWGKKKRDKYLKEQKLGREAVQPKRSTGPTEGWEEKLKIADFKSIEVEEKNIIIMPAGMDMSRLARHTSDTNTEFNRSYIVYSGSRYDEDRNTHAFVFNTKEGFDFMWQTLLDWYS